MAGLIKFDRTHADYVRHEHGDWWAGFMPLSWKITGTNGDELRWGVVFEGEKASNVLWWNCSKPTDAYLIKVYESNKDDNSWEPDEPTMSLYEFVIEAMTQWLSEKQSLGEIIGFARLA